MGGMDDSKLIECLAQIAMEDPDETYGVINYKDKTILDIGADVGSTAIYFFRKGAKQVIAVEGDAELYKLLMKHVSARWFPNIIPYFKWVQEPAWLENIIQKHKPDVVKSDCEGCEKHLVWVDDEIFSSVNEYVMEVHSSFKNSYLFGKPTRNINWSIYWNLLGKFEKNNFEIVQDYECSGARILYARNRRMEK